MKKWQKKANPLRSKKAEKRQLKRARREAKLKQEQRGFMRPAFDPRRKSRSEERHAHEERVRIRSSPKDVSDLLEFNEKRRKLVDEAPNLTADEYAERMKALYEEYKQEAEKVGERVQIKGTDNNEVT